MQATQHNLSCGVVLSTYNSPQLLEKVLWGYELQTHAAFDVYIADDGSGQETFDLIDQFRKRGKLRLHHVWHEDDGFRKTEILNKAIEQTSEDYLIFSDGDCIPTPTFVADHLDAARPGHFVAATLFRMDDAPSKAVTYDDVASEQLFSVRWLRQHGQPWSYKLLRLGLGRTAGSALNRMTPTLLYWAGCNASGWRKDIVAINGFDERLKYGGEDKEFGERLINTGIRPISCRYTLICMHQEHGRGYVCPEARAKNLEIRKQVREQRRTWTEFGIVKQADSAARPQGERRAA
ncbi:MAG: glycosyltransferase [Planctomycetaceae bacterium]|nr:glycosyltransferase [Planctomycetaceae bacterium]MCB9951128.1 glycosyltransferase [Planctomycetaceae bacterium]